MIVLKCIAINIIKLTLQVKCINKQITQYVEMTKYMYNIITCQSLKIYV